jgi:uncharacterized protein YcgI (DUF1989 family)
LQIERDISGPMDERIQTDHAFYDRLITNRPHYALIEEAVLQPYSGKGFLVSPGRSLRVVLLEHPQIADVGLWSSEDSRESLSATRTHLLEGWFLKPHSRLWSDVPYLRPMATCIGDTVGANRGKSEYHDHWVGTHCAPEWMELRGAGPGKNGCRANLLEAIEPFGIVEDRIRDNINVHQKSRIDSENGHVFGAPSEGAPGDFVEIYAEIDLVIGVSVCPNADNTKVWSDPQDNAVHPIKVEIYDTGIPPNEFPRWHDWRRSWRGHWEPLDEAYVPSRDAVE